MRTFVSKTSCGYLIAQNSKIGERRTEIYSSSDALSRPSLPQTAGLHTLCLKVLNWTSQCISTYQRGHPFLTTRTRTTLSTDLFRLRKGPTLVPKASFKSFVRPTSPHQQTSESYHQHQLFTFNEVRTKYPFFTTRFQSSIHPSPPVLNPIPYTSIRPICIHPKQPNNPSINAPIPSCRPYLAPSAQDHLSKPTKSKPFNLTLQTWQSLAARVGSNAVTTHLERKYR